MEQVIAFVLMILAVITSGQSEAHRSKFSSFEGKLELPENNTFAECQRHIKLLYETAGSGLKRSWAEDSE
jgi:hypothetical protein